MKRDNDGFEGEGMAADDPKLPKAAKLGIATLVEVSKGVMDAYAEDPDSVPKAHAIAFEIIHSAYTGGDKDMAFKLLTEATMQERREAATLFSLLVQFGRQALEVCTSAAVKMDDEFVYSKDGKSGDLWLGEGAIPEEHKQHKHGPDCMPPQIGMLKAMIEAMGGTVEAEIVDKETFDKISGGVRRLQEDYDEPSDPIRDIARQLKRDKKALKLDPKKLPEC